MGFGGPVSSVSALCESLVQSGAEVTVYTIAYGNRKPSVAILNGVQVHYFKGNYGEPCQVSRQLWQALKATCAKYQVVHLHTWWNLLIFRSLHICKKQGVPCIISVRGMLSNYSFGHRKVWLKSYFQRTAGVKLLAGVGLQATSEAEAKEMSLRANRPLEEVDIIPNLLSLTHAQRYEAPPQGFVLGLLSRLHHKKGIDLLLQAVAQVPQVTELILGGSGEPEYEEWMRSEIRRLGIAQKVTFAGWVGDAQKEAFFKKIHVFILPSYNENFANVVAESWSMAKPAIISSGVGLHKFLDEYDAGWKCEPTLQSVAEAIKKAWHEKHLWSQKGQAALQLVRSELNGPQLVQAYLAMYEQKAFLHEASNQPEGATAQKRYTLGLNAYHSDASAALYCEGDLVAAAEEERFNRIKHWAGFPHEAVQYCLREAGISIHEVSSIAIARDPRAKWDKKVKYIANNPRAISFALRGRLTNASAAQTVADELANQYLVKKELIQEKIMYVEHHRSHLASTFFASPFDEAAILSIDGSGDFSTTMMGRGIGNHIEVLNSIDFPHSLGIFYTTFTQLLGFSNYGDEYKVMGLAAYGVPRFAKDLSDILLLQKDGTFRLDLNWFRSGSEGYVYYSTRQTPILPDLFTQKLIERFGKPRQKDEPITQYHMDLAASVQHTAEQCLFHMMRHLHQATGLRKICLAGGVAQNSVANGKITMQTPFEEVYIPPAGHDAGLALGAALWVHNQLNKGLRSKPLLTAFTGPCYTNSQVEDTLQGHNVTWRLIEDFDHLCRKVASVIDAGGVVGWFRGRSEFGPRALGNRSILADPRRADAKDLLNRKIKRRESFRPFAPAVLEDYSGQYFALSDTTPFMEKVFPIRKEKQTEIPAVTHVDGTGRIQTVSRQLHPDFYRLIEAFFKLTGVPILLNTSFNENEPIVNTPAEALDCFLRTKMDLLVMQDIVVSRD
ncbi:MAG: glycosyltransferase [Chitinophagaceae bacterium]|nr:glycosyltransferase [Chitinophagaceae bacterium]